MSECYGEFIKLIRDQGKYFNPPSVELGEIISTSPLSIKTSDITLSKENLYISEHLLKDNIEVSFNGEVKVEGSAKNITIDKKKVDFDKTLRSGDGVALIKISSSKFLVLCKVVKL
ncbi:DUF2577 domain-containing protein [Clostridium sp. Marseille-QA1073]